MDSEVQKAGIHGIVDIYKFIFKNIWHFLGTAALIALGFAIYIFIFKPDLIKQYTQEKKPVFIESKFEPALKSLV